MAEIPEAYEKFQIRVWNGRSQLVDHLHAAERQLPEMAEGDRKEKNVMSKALRCNRCGEFFDPADPQCEASMHFSNPVIVTPKAIAERRVEGYLYEENGSKGHDITVDLCPECTVQFITFMEGNELAIDANKFDSPDKIIRRSAVGWLNPLLSETNFNK